MRLLGAVLIFTRVDAAAPPSNAATRRALRELAGRWVTEASGDGLVVDRSTPENPAGDRRGFSVLGAALVAANFQIGLPVRRALLRLLGIKDRQARARSSADRSQPGAPCPTHQ